MRQCTALTDDVVGCVKIERRYANEGDLKHNDYNIELNGKGFTFGFPEGCVNEDSSFPRHVKAISQNIDSSFKCLRPNDN